MRAGIRPACCVIPAAGLGTRLRPLTDTTPKELLPLAGRPVIDHVLDELRAAGIDRVIAVTREGKEALEQHLRAAGAECVRQPEPLGLGHAVAQAEPLLGGAPFAVALPDSLYRAPAVMRSVLEAGPHAVAVERVPPERVSRFGIVALTDGRVTGVVEKPAPADAPSDLAIAARYLLGPTVFDALRATAPDATGELGLSQALDLLAREERLAAVLLPDGARRVDVGTLAAYEDAQRAS
jgi:UTP--glucose-1-phosphate uridylyltransferase